MKRLERLREMFAPDPTMDERYHAAMALAEGIEQAAANGDDGNYKRLQEDYRFLTGVYYANL